MNETTFAEILVDVPNASHPYTYRVPFEMEPLVAPGVAVRVPFGNRADVGGFVLTYPAAPPSVAARPIKKVAPGSLIPDGMVPLLDWIASHYLCSRYQVYQAALPKGLLKGEPATKELLVARLRDPQPDDLKPRQHAILAILADHGGRRPVVDLVREAKTTRPTLEALARAGAIWLAPEPIRRTPVRIPVAGPIPELTQEQATALEAIKAGNREEVFLLHGVTGSGKTEVYLRAIEAELSIGRKAIVLVPEISLTPQAIARFAARFGDRIAVLHSGLSDGERYDEWCRARSGEAWVVVGARSAIFAPVEPLGLIIVDEEHDSAYKQEQIPRYHARAVALQRARFEGAKVVLGSATPSLEAYHAAQRGRFKLLTLSSRVRNLPLPPVQLVDMRAEAQDGQPGLLSRALIRALGQTLEAGDQAIILLNRRGYAPFVLCRACGTTAECPNCSVSLTYHKEADALRCHYCGHGACSQSRCDQCGGYRTKYQGAGTQKIVEILGQLFPEARTLRMDRDTTSRKGSHADILEAFGAGAADILVGTQMVAKGLDFERVSLVGVLGADAALRLPDFRAAERTFQLVTQVAGRAGRARPGRVVVQAFAPDHPALQAAARHDYSTFFQVELEMRQTLGYPPFGRIIVAAISAKNETAADETAKALRAALSGAPCEVMGPAPAPLFRLEGLHRFLVVLKTRNLPDALDALKAAIEKVGRRDVRIMVDVDAVSLM